MNDDDSDSVVDMILELVNERSSRRGVEAELSWLESEDHTHRQVRIVAVLVV